MHTLDHTRLAHALETFKVNGTLIHNRERPRESERERERERERDGDKRHTEIRDTRR
jgi:hypothetical protein